MLRQLRTGDVILVVKACASREPYGNQATANRPTVRQSSAVAAAARLSAASAIAADGKKYQTDQVALYA
jgi:hypothetical protein